MEVLDKIAALPTRPLGPFAGDVPEPLVVIEKASVIGEEPPAPASSAAAPAKAATAARADRKPARKSGGA
jgi:peptidyl-prolyl cis-trans isomerase A (cyclophilin A)